jgi:SAM-dependent methyltransferase
MKKSTGFMEQLKAAYRHESFQPSFWSILINPYYIVRKGLFEGIKANSKNMRGRLLDFGCGSKPYKNLFAVDEYVGLDIERRGHDHADEEVDVLYDGLVLPFKDGCFDSVFSSEVFEHVFNPENILRELHRVMKPGAAILLTTCFAWDEHEIPWDFARYTSFGLKHLFESAGFEVIVMEKTTRYVETVFQMWNAYISQFVLPSNNYLKLLLAPFVTAPVTIVGMLLSLILPDKRTFYHNNIIVARKRDDTNLENQQ